MEITVENVKKAKNLLEQGNSLTSIESDTGIDRKSIKNVIALYDQMNLKFGGNDKSSEYVRIKKKRYMMQSIKLQHKMADMRAVYIRRLQVYKNKQRSIRELLDRQEEYALLKQEMYYKQKMLEVTSSNLQHAEDGYEYIKQEWHYTKALWFLYGMSFLILSLGLYGKFVKPIVLG